MRKFSFIAETKLAGDRTLDLSPIELHAGEFQFKARKFESGMGMSLKRKNVKN